MPSTDPKSILLKQPQYVYREAVLGEHVVGRDPDCSRVKSSICNPPVIRRNIDANKDLIVHEGYDKKANWKNDIALIRMDDAVPLFQENPSVSAANPICLPWSRESYAYDIDDGDIARVAGWGRTREKAGNKKSRQDLLKLKVNVAHLQQLKVPIANDLCKRKFRGIDTERQICAGGEDG